ncbi:hypothetical protein O988_09248 [Pseudogymnoascus sp. VKM F-3808]|nr:hypothetical protein O988_09248 [Pseudogymnoascus sp. VKM F-3808]
MPHFSFWTWPNPLVGPFDAVLAKIAAIEEATGWGDKIDKAVWRGTMWFSPIGNKDLRKGLVRLGKGKEWADIEHVRGDIKNATTGVVEKGNTIGIEEFCRYKYVIYTDGVTYSGRLAFHQACASVLITPPPTFLQHTTHLLRPLYSPTLDTPPPPHPEWPSYSASEANVIFVQPDWSDLEATIMWLRENPEVAEGIARRGREEVVRRGMFREAAETCYWRGLVRGWASVAKGWEGEEDMEGERWEEWSVRGVGNKGGRTR